MNNGLPAPEELPAPRAARPARAAAVRWLRRSCLAAGAGLLAFVAGARLHSALASNADLERFRTARLERGASASLPVPAAEVDRSLWADSRVAAYEGSLAADLGLPLALLRIRRLALEVPVWPGTDALTLNRGLGHIAGTSLPGGAGNVGLAGHRDGFFRVLKDIAVGDELELETLGGVERFAVDELLVVDPEADWVLASAGEPSLTLVTCYPFYFVGRAPFRFIVRASPRSRDAAASNGGTAQQTSGSQPPQPGTPQAGRST